MKRKTLLLIVVLFAGYIAKSQSEPLAFLLTWTEDPTTTMTIDWHNHDKQPQTLYYKMVDEKEWSEEVSNIHPCPYSDRIVHRVA